MHPITVRSRRLSRARLEREHPGAVTIDVTSKSELPWQRFSPFFPVGGIPVPGRDEMVSQSVEGIWQGLKVKTGGALSKVTISSLRVGTNPFAVSTA